MSVEMYLATGRREPVELSTSFDKPEEMLGRFLVPGTQ